MALNYPGPFEVRLFYTTNEPAGVNEHVLRLSCQISVEGDPGDPFSDWIPIDKGGNAVGSLDGDVDALVTLLKPMFNTAVDFSLAELWEYQFGTFDSVFRSSYDINQSGTAATATVNHSQTIWSFRTALGGTMKIDLRGTIHGSGAQQSFPTGVAAANSVATAFLASNSIWWGRDNSYPVAAIRWLPGLNEHSFKQINR